MYTLTEIIEGYQQGKIKGWDEEVAFEHFRVAGREFGDFKLSNQVASFDDLPDCVFLYRCLRKCLGKDLINVNQQIGDCVSWSGRNTSCRSMAAEIVMGRELELFKDLFPPYFYGTSRVQIGRGGIRGDGSVGEWLAKAVIKYGMLAVDEPGVPQYSGSIARQWGNSGPPEQFLNLGVKHLIKSAAKINNVEELCLALASGYSCSVCSNVGYEMTARSDGLHRRSGNWAHALTFDGFYKGKKGPRHILVPNSWADVHGHLKDFETGEDIPVGYLRISFEDADYMIKSGGETYAFSGIDGFPDRSERLRREMFKLVGN